MQDQKISVSVYGLGYVGLTLSIVLAEEGFKVYGIDNDRNKIKLLNKNKFHEQQNLQIDSSKAKKFLSWKTTYNTKKAVEVTTEWYSKILRSKKSAEDVTKQQIKEYMKYS